MGFRQRSISNPNACRSAAVRARTIACSSVRENHEARPSTVFFNMPFFVQRLCGDLNCRDGAIEEFTVHLTSAAVLEHSYLKLWRGLALQGRGQFRLQQLERKPAPLEFTLADEVLFAEFRRALKVFLSLP